MNARKILVIYDTLDGSTAEIAVFMAKKLTQMGRDVRAERVTEIQNIDGLSSLILGTPITMGQWTNLMQEFLKRNRNQIQQCSCAFFITCLAKMWGTKNGDEVQGLYLNTHLAKFPEIAPVAIGVFGALVKSCGNSFQHVFR